MSLSFSRAGARKYSQIAGDLPSSESVTHPQAVVVTATIGEPLLAEAVASVQRQTYRPLRHVVVIDGVAHESAARVAMADAAFDDVPVDVLVLADNTGGQKHFGHHIYATASTHIGPEDLVCFLDADNVFDPEHVESCVQAVTTTGASWAYALRRIVDNGGRFFCPDDCDSLGFWPRYRTHFLGTTSLPPEEAQFLLAVPYLVDTSCYALRFGTLDRWSRCWEIGRGADCVFATELIRHERGVGTGRRTVGYRLDIDTRQSTAEYFLRGNKLVRERFGDELPWTRPEQGRLVLHPEHLATRF
jgi:glycosyltransferase involved in cell wall biosynthesis